jgi:hypothetical protein
MLLSPDERSDAVAPDDAALVDDDDDDSVDESVEFDATVVSPLAAPDVALTGGSLHAPAEAKTSRNTCFILLLHHQHKDPE